MEAWLTPDGPALAVPLTLVLPSTPVSVPMLTPLLVLKMCHALAPTRYRVQGKWVHYSLWTTFLTSNSEVDALDSVSSSEGHLLGRETEGGRERR